MGIESVAGRGVGVFKGAGPLRRGGSGQATKRSDLLGSEGEASPASLLHCASGRFVLK